MPIKIFYNGRSEDELVIGMTRDSDLKRVLNQAGERLQIPEEGLLISRRMAQRLGVRTGDKVRVETKMSVGATHSSSCWSQVLMISYGIGVLRFAGNGQPHAGRETDHQYGDV
jgi:anaerobic selenocysteine-containing dehydrogenase